MSTNEKIFHLERVNHQELLQVLLSFFGHAKSTSQGYRYHGGGEDFFLEVQLDRTGKILEINPSKEFSGEELARLGSRIEEILIDNQIPMIGQIVAFSSERVEGYFRYGDLFQIIPVPDRAPKPKVLIADHPFLLQFSYVSCPDITVDNIRRSRKTTVYVRLLNLLNVPITLGSRYIRFSWIMNTKDPNGWTSEWRQEGYTYKGLSGKISKYTPVAKLQPIKRIPSHKYYSEFRAISSKPLRFPDNLENSFDLAFGLNARDWEKFFMACSWYYQAQAIWRESNSSSFVALVSAMECLIAKPERCPDCGQALTEGIEKCDHCGQSRYKVTKRFKEFLEKYVPFLEKRFPEEKKLLYRVRSELSHGMDLLTRDLKPWYFMMNARAEKQDALQRNLHFIARTAINNWLWNRGKG